MVFKWKRRASETSSLYQQCAEPEQTAAQVPSLISKEMFFTFLTGRKAIRLLHGELSVPGCPPEKTQGPLVRRCRRRI